ncbi:MAG: NYN domain-containing protein [Bacteroidota bacterium]
MPQRSRAALFVDYHDLYIYLSKEADYPEDTILDLVDAAREYITSRTRSIPISACAYADYETLNTGAVQKGLYNLGVDARPIGMTGQKSTVDMALAIDFTETIYTQADLVDTLVILSAVHDYLPLVHLAQRTGQRIVLIAFRPGASTSLLQTARDCLFVDANQLLENSSRRTRSRAESYRGTEFRDVEELPYEMDRHALQIIEAHFGQYDEVYLSPLLRKLSEELGDVEGHEPKSLIGDLENAGAVRLEKRRGIEHDYTVLIVNTEHPDVQTVREEQSTRTRSYAIDRGFDDDYDDDWED